MNAVDWPAHVTIREVGLRDGLQSIVRTLPTAQKLQWIQGAYDAGIREIEVGSFVPPKLLPQLADTAELVAFAKTLPGLCVSVLVPNPPGARRGMERRRGRMLALRRGREAPGSRPQTTPVRRATAGAVGCRWPSSTARRTGWCRAAVSGRGWRTPGGAGGGGAAAGAPSRCARSTSRGISWWRCATTAPPPSATPATAAAAWRQVTSPPHWPTPPPG